MGTAEEPWTPIVSMETRTGEPVMLFLTQEPVWIMVMRMEADTVPAAEALDKPNKRLTIEVLLMLDEVMISDMTTASLVTILAAVTTKELLTPMGPMEQLTGEPMVLVMTQKTGSDQGQVVAGVRGARSRSVGRAQRVTGARRAPVARGDGAGRRAGNHGGRAEGGSE